MLRSGQLPPFQHFRDQQENRWPDRATPPLPAGSNRFRMLLRVLGLQNMSSRRVKGSLAGRTVRRFVKFGFLTGLRSVEINRDEFRRQLAQKHGLWVPSFDRMKDVPLEQLDEIAKVLIRKAERMAMAEGAGFGLGGMMTVLPDASLLTVITLRLIQRLCLLYGFDVGDDEDRIEMWKAAATAAGVDYGKDLAEKQLIEKLAPRIVERMAMKIGAESAEKWVGRMIPLASSAIGGGLNFFFVRSWGRRVQRNLRARHVAERPTVPLAMGPYIVSQNAVV